MNKFLACCFSVLGALCALAAAYNFEDSTYNQILADDLENLYDSLEQGEFLHVRNRRDEGAVTKDNCRRRWPKLCCANDLFEKMHRNELEDKKECHRELMKMHKDEKVKSPNDPFHSCERFERFRKDMICVTQCVAKQRNIVDDDGNVNDDEVRKSFLKDFGELEWLKPLADGISAKCISEAKNATLYRETPGPFNCNPAAMKLFHCFFREIQLNCPGDQIADEKSCSRFREHAKRDSFMMGPPPSQSLEENDN